MLLRFFTYRGLNIGCTPTWRDSCYLDPEGEAMYIA